jgi:hypothetical protein
MRALKFAASLVFQGVDKFALEPYTSQIETEISGVGGNTDAARTQFLAYIRQERVPDQRRPACSADSTIPRSDHREIAV